jgi:hypothetical protein
MAAGATCFSLLRYACAKLRQCDASLFDGVDRASRKLIQISISRSAFYFYQNAILEMYPGYAACDRARHNIRRCRY